MAANDTGDFSELTHLKYELGMFKATGQLLRYAGRDGAIRNALVESFAIHTRALILFYFPGQNPRADDILAARYCRPETPWPYKGIPDGNKHLLDAKVRADKQIAHLTKDRGHTSSVGKTWPVSALVHELNILEAEFQNHAVDAAKVILWGATP
tara:strand:+ start:77 stop:538 length:462 start_codon:yes stop_codon:yes gene_type:complete